MEIKASAEITLARVDDGKPGKPGEKGDPGKDGDSGIVVSTTPPKNPNIGQLWQAKAGDPIKRWTGTGWVIHYISVENLKADVLSAITANLGTITAGVIKSISGDTVIDVKNGTIKTHSGISDPSEEITRLEIGKGKFLASRKDGTTALYETSYGGESIDFNVGGQKKKGLHWSYNASDGGYVDIVSGWSTLDHRWDSKDDFPIIENLKKVKQAVATMENKGFTNISDDGAVHKYKIGNEIHVIGSHVAQSTGDYILLFTKAKLQELFGTPFDMTRFSISTFNGDTAAARVHLYAPEFWGWEIYQYYYPSHNGPIRINYHLVYKSAG